MPTGGTPQAAIFNDTEVSNCKSPNALQDSTEQIEQIVSVGNESKVYHWGKTNGELKFVSDATSSSLFSVAYNSDPTHLQVRFCVRLFLVVDATAYFFFFC